MCGGKWRSKVSLLKGLIPSMSLYFLTFSNISLSFASSFISTRAVWSQFTACICKIINLCICLYMKKIVSAERSTRIRALWRGILTCFCRAKKKGFSWKWYFHARLLWSNYSGEFFFTRKKGRISYAKWKVLRSFIWKWKKLIVRRNAKIRNKKHENLWLSI